MQMMNVLKPIAFDVVICMSQLFDYYLFSVSVYLMLLCTYISSSSKLRSVRANSKDTYHLSELAYQTSPVLRIIPLLIRTILYPTLFTVPYFSVRSPRSSALRYVQPSWMSVKITLGGAGGLA